MKRINLLDEQTSNKIAAGEVVERPSSVVKELIENSIDAFSSNITIEIEDSGQSLIKVIDDGIGIHPNDMEKAFMPHATSKIKNVEDIFAIKTLGFRGEALASIAAVSKLTMKSKRNDFNFGYEILIEGGNIKDKKEIGFNKGTSIEVCDLFFNIPARKKFLKSKQRETSLINEIVSKIALSNPSVSFTLFNSGKKVLQTFGNGILKDVIRSIYGKQITDEILYFEEHLDTLSVSGYIGRESISRGSRTNQSIFVNNRYIKNQLIGVAVENAFKSFSTVNKHPFFIIFVEIFPELIDVNIHPTKAEIKFDNEREVFKAIFDTVHSRLKKDVADTFSLPEEISKEEEKVEKIAFDFKNSVSNKNIINETKNIKKDLYVDTKDNFNLNKTQTVKLPIDLKSSNICENANALNLYASKTNSSKNNALNSSINDIKIKDEVIEPKLPSIKIIGQFNKTYIIGEFNQELYLIDQHAAHEKILFEKYINDISKRDILIQPLLVPCIIDLSLSDYGIFIENKDIFKITGFLIEEFGGDSVMLKEVPYFLDKIDSKKLFLDILDNLKNLGSGKTTEVKYNKIATMACKSAVKANDELNNDEMERLIKDLKYLDNPFHCPHGRPTIIKITLKELEKKFKRIQ